MSAATTLSGMIDEDRIAEMQLKRRRVRRMCARQRAATSQWWRDALQRYAQRRMWMHLGPPKQGQLPERFVRIYEVIVFAVGQYHSIVPVHHLFQNNARTRLRFLCMPNTDEPTPRTDPVRSFSPSVSRFSRSGSRMSSQCRFQAFQEGKSMDIIPDAHPQVCLILFAA